MQLRSNGWVAEADVCACADSEDGHDRWCEVSIVDRIRSYTDLHRYVDLRSVHEPEEEQGKAGKKGRGDGV